MKSTLSEIHELERESGGGTLGGSVKSVTRRISAGFPSASPVGEIVNSGPVWSI